MQTTTFRSLTAKCAFALLVGLYAFASVSDAGVINHGDFMGPDVAYIDVTETSTDNLPLYGAPITIGKGRREKVVDADDHIKPETTIEGLARLRPAFGEGGLVTAGNASGIVDGAAALVVTTEDEAKNHGLTARAVIKGWAIVGLDPTLMSLGPVPAIEALWAKTGVGRDEVDFYEINEAFQ